MSPSSLFCVLVALVAIATASVVEPLKAETAVLVEDINEQYAEAFEMEYPEVVANYTTTIKSALGYPLYKQCGSSYSGDRVGTCSSTMCQVGCAVSSVAMMISGHGGSKNPGQLNAWLKGHGGYAGGCNLIWSSVNSLSKLKFVGIQNAGYSTVCSGLQKGHGIVANVHAGRHWVLLTGCRGGGVYSVNDPGFNQGTYSANEVVRIAVYH